MKSIVATTILVGGMVLTAAGQIPIERAVGLVLPREGGGMNLRQADGAEIGVRWTDATTVVLEVNTRQLRNVKADGTAKSPAEVARESLSPLELESLDNSENTFARASAVVERFLSAPNRKERLKLVRDAKRVEPLMEKFYERNDDAPVKYRRPEGGWKFHPYKSFLLGSVEKSDFTRTPIALERQRDGSFLVDWESFVGFCEIPWDQISTRRSTDSFTVRVRASMGDYFNYRFDEDGWVCLRLEDIARQSTLYGYVDRNSLLMNEIMDAMPSEKGGAHLTLQVAYPLGVRDDSKDQLQIEALIAKGWVSPSASESPELPRFPGGVLRYRVHSSDQIIEFPLPAGPITGAVMIEPGRKVETALRLAREENWIAERGLSLYFDEELGVGEPSNPGWVQFVGRYDLMSEPRTLTVGGQSYEISLKKGGQSTALLYNVVTTADIKPYVYRAAVSGVGTVENNGSIAAGRIILTPIGDQVAQDDPKLPRYLFIGDSISGNYGRGLREALNEKFNLHHPPTNCGPSKKGRSHITEWLGGYKRKGRQWDVISFNFGHWDSGNDKTTYQSNLEAVIAELKKTGAKLIWVTTCPVPRGMPPAGDLTKEGRAPGRTSGVMQKYLNPWAAEVIARHPEISTCDQWQFVKDREGDLYREWWLGKNVHFGGEQADELGRFLGRHVMELMSN